MAGINAKRVKIIAFVLAGVFAAVGGMFDVLNAGASNSVFGNGREFRAIICCAIGGISMSGGAGSSFGVALGAAEPQLFLLCYLHARKQQEKEIEARNSKIRARGMTVGHFQPDQDTEVTVMAYHAADPELQSFVETARRFFTNDITAAAGLYYQGFHSNYISRKQEEQIFSNLNAYALCVAELQPVEGEA